MVPNCGGIFLDFSASINYALVNMSVSYSAKVFWGVRIEDDDLQVRKPNPKWDGGKTRFDPQTGEKITQDIVTKLYADDLARKFKLEYEETYRDEVVFGLPASEAIDLEHDDSIAEVNSLPEDKTNKARESIAALLAYLGLDLVEPRLYLVTSVS
jgi:hypothetical protein